MKTEFIIENNRSVSCSVDSLNLQHEMFNSYDIIGENNKRMCNLFLTLYYHKSLNLFSFVFLKA